MNRFSFTAAGTATLSVLAATSALGALLLVNPGQAAPRGATSPAPITSTPTQTATSNTHAAGQTMSVLNPDGTKRAVRVVYVGPITAR